MDADYQLVVISYETILPIWQQYLWSNRTDPIEPQSAIVYGRLKTYDVSTHPVTYFGMFFVVN